MANNESSYRITPTKIVEKTFCFVSLSISDCLHGDYGK